VAAVSEGTFEAAARQLHVTPSAISQRLKALEASVGRVLLVRTKPVRATPSGEALLRAGRQIRAITEDALGELGGTGPGGAPAISVAVNADSLETWLMPALARVRGDVAFDLHRADQQRTAELLRQGAVMAAVTASAKPVPGCTLFPLGRMRYQPRASGSFAAAWFVEGVRAAALARAPMVVFDRDDHLQDDYLRRRCGRRLEPPRHYVPGTGAFLRAVQLGLGWGMVPDLQVPSGESGLVDLDPEGALDVKLYWQQWRLHSRPLDHLASAVHEAAKAFLR
jgi:LysR family transcriptional regulator (chromosome initiation inhibitor)